jgi:hypothetical protein
MTTLACKFEIFDDGAQNRKNSKAVPKQALILAIELVSLPYEKADHEQQA